MAKLVEVQLPRPRLRVEDIEGRMDQLLIEERIMALLASRTRADIVSGVGTTSIAKCRNCVLDKCASASGRQVLFGGVVHRVAVLGWGQAMRVVLGLSFDLFGAGGLIHANVLSERRDRY